MKKSVLNIYVLSSTLLFSFSSSSVMAKEYYKWVDAKGSTHYTATPPPKNAKKQSRIETYGTKTTTTPTSQSEQVPVTNTQEQSTPDTQVEIPTPLESTQPAM